MHSIVVLLCVAAALMQTSANALPTKFSPSFARLAQLAAQKQILAKKEYRELVDQIQENHERYLNSTTAQIINLKTIVLSALHTHNTSKNVAACLKDQEKLAHQLSDLVLNNCTAATNLSLLSKKINFYEELKNLSNSTEAHCVALNPLDSQKEMLEQCLNEKVADLNLQFNLLETEYQQLSREAIARNVECLTGWSTKLIHQIGLINFNINICFFS